MEGSADTTLGEDGSGNSNLPSHQLTYASPPTVISLVGHVENAPVLLIHLSLMFGMNKGRSYKCAL